MFVSVMLGGACAAAGLLSARQLHRRCARLRSWQRALIAMRAANAYLRADCSQILRAGAAEIACLAPIARAVEISGADAGRLFERDVKEILLRPEERAALLPVMRALSGGGREEIDAALTYALARFVQFCADSEEKRDTDARMRAVLGILGGACVFLILW